MSVNGNFLLLIHPAGESPPASSATLLGQTTAGWPGIDSHLPVHQHQARLADGRHLQLQYDSFLTNSTITYFLLYQLFSNLLRFLTNMKALQMNFLEQPVLEQNFPAYFLH